MESTLGTPRKGLNLYLLNTRDISGSVGDVRVEHLTQFLSTHCVHQHLHLINVQMDAKHTDGLNRFLFFNHHSERWMFKMGVNRVGCSRDLSLACKWMSLLLSDDFSLYCVHISSF